MPPRKQPRDKATGQFKAKVAPAPRKRRPPAPAGAQAAGNPAFNPFRMAAEQQGWLAGHGPGWWISDHLEELRHFVSWIYVGVHKIAQQWAQATVNVYDASREELYGGPLAKAFRGRPDVLAMARHLRTMRRKSAAPDAPAEQRTPVADHPIALKLDEPNPYTSGRIFRYQVACQMRLTGGCYIWEVPDQFGSPAHLWVIPRGWARPMPPTGQYPMGAFQISPVLNTFTSGIASPSVSTWYVPWEQMIQIGYPDPLYPGEFKSPLAACSRIIDIMEQTDTATWSSFVNAVKPSLVFNIDPKTGTLPTQEMMDQFQAQLEAFKQGANNHGKILMMLGLTAQQLMSGPSELDYVNGRQQNRESVLAIQGVAPVMTGLGGATSYSEAAVQAKATIAFSVAPDLDMFGDRLTKRWRPMYGDDFEICLEPEHFDDPTLDQAMIDKIFAARQIGDVSTNEHRAALKLPPLDDPIADIPEVLLRSMMEPHNEEGEPNQADPYAAFDGDALGDDLPDDTDTGISNQTLAEAPGRMKRFSLNGLKSMYDEHQHPRDSHGQWTDKPGETVVAGRRTLADVPHKHRLATPVKGPTGAKIVGYEWRHREGERWSHREGGMVNARVSDWDSHAVSEGTGRKIVHLFHVEHPAGHVTVEGVQSAQKLLGIHQTKLQSIAKREAETQRYKKEQDARTAAEIEKRAHPTPGEAAADLRQRNYSPLRPHDDGSSLFAQSVLMEKDGKFYRAVGDNIQLLEEHGWKRHTPAEKSFSLNGNGVHGTTD